MLYLFCYLGKWLKPGTTAPGTGRYTTKQEDFFLSEGILTLHPRDPFVNILQDKLAISDETRIPLQLPPERKQQFISFSAAE